MREALAHRLPQLTRFYPGLMPWHLDRMRYCEISEYLTQLDRALAEQE